jgi:hypothetical protein
MVERCEGQLDQPATIGPRTQSPVITKQVDTRRTSAGRFEMSTGRFDSKTSPVMLIKR